MADIKINIKLPSKSEIDNQLSALLKNGYELNFDSGNLKNVVSEISKELEKLKTILSSVNNNPFNNTSDGAKKTKKEVQELNNELTKINDGKLASTSIISDKSGNITEVNKYRDSIAQTTTETIKNGEVTKQVVTENIAQFDKLKTGLQDKLNIASSNGLVNTSVIDSLQQKLNSINTNSSEKEVNELKQSIINLSGTDSNITRLQNAILSIENGLKSTRGKYGSLVDINDLKKSTDEINKLKQLLNEVMSGKSINSSKITSEINKATGSLKDMTTNCRNSSSAIRTASQDAMNFGSAISRAFNNAGIFLTTATAIRALTKELANAKDYIVQIDTNLTNIEMITGDSSTAVQKITDDFKNLGAELHTTNAELMAGAEEVLRAGYDTDTAKDMMESSIVGAKISGQTIETVTQQLIAIKNAFDMEGSEMSNVVDIISNMDNNSATSLFF